MGNQKAIVSEEIGLEEAATLLGVAADKVRLWADAPGSALPVLRGGSHNGYTFSKHDILALRQCGTHPILKGD